MEASEIMVPRLRLAFTDRVIRKAIAESLRQLGYEQATEHQAKAIFQFVTGKDVLVLLPTGSGKSLCYVALPLVFDYLKSDDRYAADGVSKSVVVVVSPLTALMKDQVRKYNPVLPCTFIGEEQSDLERVAGGEYSLVYASPECLLTVPRCRDMLASDVYKHRLVAIAVDEAHCIESWGPEFRTEYGNISELRSILPEDVNVMALTATASPKMACTISDKLCMDKPCIVRVLPNKPNIKYIVKLKPSDVATALLPFVQDIKEKGINASKTIIFCRTYASFVDVATTLVTELHCRDAFNVILPDGTQAPVCQLFSASSSTDVKDQILHTFTDPDGHIRIIVATIAFGMGLDAPNVRNIVHWGPSDSVEAYVQESGRCGRDGSPSIATLYFERREIARNAPVSNAMKVYCGNFGFCRRKLLMREFDPAVDLDSLDLPNPLHMCCDVCEADCACSECNPEMNLSEQELLEMEECEDVVTYKTGVNHSLERKLLELRDSMCRKLDDSGHPVPLLFGVEIASGLPNETIHEIALQCQSISCVNDVVKLGVMSYSHAQSIFDIVKSHVQ